MGIKFHCPNGHKLNVKSFLSGRKAICPKCGARVVVPEQSTIDEPQDSDPFDPLAQPALHDQALGSSSVIQPVPVSPNVGVTKTKPGPPLPAMPVTSASAPDAPQVSIAALTVAPAELGDPIGAAPSAAWYVRPATGGQFGPAPGETMRAWIAEGRVSPQALVWCAGWHEWRSAAAVFPQSNQAALALTDAALSSPAPAPPIGVVIAPVQPAGLPIGQIVERKGGTLEPAADTSSDILARSRRRRRQRSNMMMKISVTLVLLTVVLGIVLIIVLSGQKSSAPPPSVSQAKSALDADR